MSEKPFIKFWPSDFLGGTSGLSPAERGIYITLLCLIYDMDGPIKRDDVRLARRCGAPKVAFKRCLEELIDQGKISEENGLLSNKRAETALMDRTNRIQKSTHAANSRWNAQEQKNEQKQGKENAGALPEECKEACHLEAEPEPDIDDEEEDAREAGKSGPDPGEVMTLREQILEAIGADPISGITGPNGTIAGTMADMDLVGRWRADLGLTDREILSVVTEVMQRKRDGPPRSFGYFTDAMRTYAGQRNRPTLTPREINHEHFASDHRPPRLSQNRPDPALEQIARLTGLGKASGDGGF